MFLANRPKPVVNQQLNIERLYIGELLVFQCELQLSTGWEYSWFKDGRELPVKSSNYSIHNASLSDSGTYDCMAIRNRTMYKTKHSVGRMLYVSGEPVILCCYGLGKMLTPSSLNKDFLQIE